MPVWEVRRAMVGIYWNWGAAPFFRVRGLSDNVGVLGDRMDSTGFGE